MKKFIKICLITSAVLLFVGIPLSSYLLVTFIFNPKIEENITKLKKYYPEIIADIKILNQDPIIPSYTFKKNAEEVMFNLFPHIIALAKELPLQFLISGCWKRTSYF